MIDSPSPPYSLPEAAPGAAERFEAAFPLPLARRLQILLQMPEGASESALYDRVRLLVAAVHPVSGLASLLARVHDSLHHAEAALAEAEQLAAAARQGA